MDRNKLHKSSTKNLAPPTSPGFRGFQTAHQSDGCFLCVPWQQSDLCHFLPPSVVIYVILPFMEHKVTFHSIRPVIKHSKKNKPNVFVCGCHHSQRGKVCETHLKNSFITEMRLSALSHSRAERTDSGRTGHETTDIKHGATAGHSRVPMRKVLNMYK